MQRMQQKSYIRLPSIPAIRPPPNFRPQSALENVFKTKRCKIKRVCEENSSRKNRLVDVLVRRGEGKEAQISFWVFVYRNVFCKGANVGLGHREEGGVS